MNELINILEFATKGLQKLFERMLIGAVHILQTLWHRLVALAQGGTTDGVRLYQTLISLSLVLAKIGMFFVPGVACIVIGNLTDEGKLTIVGVLWIIAIVFIGLHYLAKYHNELPPDQRPPLD